MNKIGIAIGVLLVFLVGALILVPYFVNLSKYKAEISQKASEAIGKPVVIKGDIALAILPSPRVSISDVLVSDLAKLDKLSLHVSLWPLLKREIEIASVTLTKPVITLKKDSRGKNNWTFAAKKSPKKEEASFFKITLNDVYIENGRMAYITPEKTTEVTDINLELELDGLEGPFELEGSLRAFEKKIKLDAKVGRLAAEMPYELELELGGEAIESAGKISRGQDSVEIKDAFIKLRKAKMPFELFASWKEVFQLKTKLYDLPGKGEVKLSASQQNKTLQGDVDLKLQSLAELMGWAKVQYVLPDAFKKPIQFSGNFSYDKELRWSPFDLRIGDARVGGKIAWAQQANTVRVQTAFKTPSLESWLALVGSASLHPLIGGSFSFSGDIRQIGKVLSIQDMSASFGTGFWLSGNVRGDMSQKRPKLDAKLATGPIDLPVDDSKESASIPPWPKTPIDFSVLEKADADLELSIPRLTRKDLTLRRVNLKAKLAEGVLTVHPLTADIYGGQLAMNSRMTSKGVLSVQSSLKNMPLEQSKYMTGQISVSNNLTTEGKNIDEWVRNLNGVVSINSQDGIVHGVDLERIAQSFGNIRDVNSILGIVNAALDGGQTPFKTYNGDIRFRNGVGTIESMTLVTSSAQASATGSINLPRYQMDVLANFQITNPRNLPPFVMKLSGPLDDPKREFDTSSLGKYLMENVGKSIFNEVVRDKAPGFLNNLFSR
ncbi:MAG: AsmA family protein [Deltaproteobacteria bacterium]|nr:AsmA family protein [Deltaproteobacteria bacterium]